MRPLTASLRIVLAVFLVSSAAFHLIHPYKFLGNVADYQIGGFNFVWLLSLAIPIWQIVLSAGLLSDKSCLVSARLITVLISWFIAAQVWAILHGNEVSCGCFGDLSGDVGLLSLILATFLFVIAIALSKPVTKRLEQTQGHPTASRRNLKRGLSLVETLFVLGILNILLAILLPAAQQMRESARQLACSSKARSVVLAALNYESSFESLPAGNLGFSDVIVYDETLLNRWHDDPSFRYFWKRAQHTSSLATLLPFMDERPLGENMPTVFTSDRLYYDYFVGSPPHSWLGEWSQVQDATEMQLDIFSCPSDSMTDFDGSKLMYVGAQAVYLTDRLGNAVEGFMSGFVHEHEGFGSTSYIGCTGAFSGGDVPDLQLRPFRGSFGSRTPVRLMELRDGQSNTVTFAETIGAISNGRREGGFSWVFGSLGRGRGGLPWGKLSHPANLDIVLFGDSRYSSIVGFGSMHPMVVNVAFADGSVRPVKRSVGLHVWYAMCGRADGEIFLVD